MSQVILHVTYRCAPDKAADFVMALKQSGLQSLVRKEDGCLQYDYTLSCELPETVVLIERWRDAAALEAHLKQPHMEAINEMKKGRVLKATVDRYE